MRKRDKQAIALAIKGAQSMGRKLAKEYPNKIVSDYKEGKSLPTIAQELCESKVANRPTGKNSIHYALVELVDKELLEELAREHMRNNGRDRRADAFKSLEHRGLKPYEGQFKDTEYGRMDEKSYIIYLRLSMRYSLVEINNKVNSIFNNNRSLHSMINQYSKWSVNFYKPKRYLHTLVCSHTNHNLVLHKK